MCGNEVISSIELILNPADSIARIAVSRPEPCPFTKILTLSIPILLASSAAFSAAVWAANGDFFRDPLNPELPAEAHDIVSPTKFVMVIIVLLNVDWI